MVEGLLAVLLKLGFVYGYKVQKPGIVSQTRTQPVVCTEERGQWVRMYVACEEGGWEVPSRLHASHLKTSPHVHIYICTHALISSFKNTSKIELKNQTC